MCLSSSSNRTKERNRVGQVVSCCMTEQDYVVLSMPDERASNEEEQNCEKQVFFSSPEQTHSHGQSPSASLERWRALSFAFFRTILCVASNRRKREEEKNARAREKHTECEKMDNSDGQANDYSDSTLLRVYSFPVWISSCEISLLRWTLIIAKIHFMSFPEIDDLHCARVHVHTSIVKDICAILSSVCLLEFPHVCSIM